ncbi:hypothetical protein CYY_003870 [Polysphondylium violaceum]|uniref:Peptidase S54 rhomboid domain-containing protein n=1 Tax=Polysphondylium violaceum TaxID=133409 RepID=A0A8J4PZ32_9MYCE|nr:hypothetical protein CYY_003870 [Polysphondylium violaceum]
MNTRFVSNLLRNHFKKINNNSGAFFKINGHSSNIAFQPSSIFNSKPNVSMVLNDCNKNNHTIYSCSFSSSSSDSNKSKFKLTLKKLQNSKRDYNKKKQEQDQWYDEQETQNNSFEQDREYYSSAKTSNSLIYGLIAINVGTFLFINSDDSYQFQRMIMDNFTLSTETFAKQPLTLLTSFFAHKDIYHLLFNMLGLYTIGTSLLYSIGTGPFLTLYLGAGIAGGLGYLALQKYYNTNNNRTLYRKRPVGALGASGAIYGVFSTYALLYPTSTLMIYGIVPVPALLLLGGYMAWDFYNEYYHKNTGIAHSGHLCGGLFGGLYYLTKLRRRY